MNVKKAWRRQKAANDPKLLSWNGNVISANWILLPKFFWSTLIKYFRRFLRWRTRFCKIFEITRTIYSNSERSEQFLVTECFLTYSWMFLIPNKSEKLPFKLEKIIGIQKLTGKVLLHCSGKPNFPLVFLRQNAIRPNDSIWVECN